MRTGRTARGRRVRIAAGRAARHGIHLRSAGTLHADATLPRPPQLPVALGPLHALGRSDRSARRRPRGGRAVVDGDADVDILNVTLGLEHEAINAYQRGAGSGLLHKPVLELAPAFQSHRKGHRDVLAATIRKLGGQPETERSLDDCAKALNTATPKNQADVLALAARLETGAANAYPDVIPLFKDNRPSRVSARLATDETMHRTALSQALGRMLPTDALSFGA